MIASPSLHSVVVDTVALLIDVTLLLSMSPRRLAVVAVVIVVAASPLQHCLCLAVDVVACGLR